jgi:peroxiredoxin
MANDSDDLKPIPPSSDFVKSGLADSSSKGSSKTRLASSAIISTLRKRHIGIPIVGLILLAIIGYTVISQDTNRLPHASSEPDPLASDRKGIADFTVQSTTGETFKLSEHHGKVVLVSFWSSDCTTCVLELPAFSELLRRYKRDGLEVLSINLDPTESGAKAAKELWSHGSFSFQAYLDPSKNVAKNLGIETVPSGVVIDRKGRMAFNSYGANDWLAPETARLIEDLLLED